MSSWLEKKTHHCFTEFGIVVEINNHLYFVKVLVHVVTVLFLPPGQILYSRGWRRGEGKIFRTLLWVGSGVVWATGFPGGTVLGKPSASAGVSGDLGPIPESGRFPGGGNGNPLQYSCLENPEWLSMHAQVWATDKGITLRERESSLLGSTNWLEALATGEERQGSLVSNQKQFLPFRVTFTLEHKHIFFKFCKCLEHHIYPNRSFSVVDICRVTWNLGHLEFNPCCDTGCAEGNGNPLSVLDWGIPRRGAWQATVHGAAKSWTRLKGLSTWHWLTL